MRSENRRERDLVNAGLPEVPTGDDVTPRALGWCVVGRIGGRRYPRDMPRLCAAIAALAACFALAACSEVANGPGMISQRIGERVRDPSATVVDLGQLTSFGWDRFIVFPPGTKREVICEAIGAGRSQCGRIIRYTAVPEDCRALAFALGHQLTHTELHALANGRFGFTPPPGGQPRRASVFRIRRETSERIWLEPA